jgi:hypothetical protein
MAELDDLLNDPERDDEREQYRITSPTTGQDTGTGERMPSVAGRPGPPTQQVAEVQPPDIKSLLRQSTGVPPVVSAGLAKDAPPPAMSSVAPPTPAGPPTSVQRPPMRPGEVPTPPTGVGNQRRMDLLRQIGTLEQPTNRQDPKYRLSLGGRIGRGLADFAAGGIGGLAADIIDPNRPGSIGPGAVNSKYGLDEAQREKTLGGVKEELGQQEKLDTSEQKIYEDAVKQAYEGQLGEARKETAAAATGRAEAAGETADVKGQLAQSQIDLREAQAQRAGQPTEPKNEIELLQAYQTALVKKDPKAAIYKAAIDQLKQLKAAGKDTSASDLAKALQVSEFRMREKDTADKEKEAERKQAYTELDKNITVKYDPQKMAAEKAKVDQGLEAKYAPKYQSIEEEAGKMLGLTKAGAKLQTPRAAPGAPPATNAAPATPTKGPKVGQTVTVKGKQYTVGKVYPNGSWDPK